MVLIMMRFNQVTFFFSLSLSLLLKLVFSFHFSLTSTPQAHICAREMRANGCGVFCRSYFDLWSEEPSGIQRQRQIILSTADLALWHTCKEKDVDVDEGGQDGIKVKARILE